MISPSTRLVRIEQLPTVGGTVRRICRNTALGEHRPRLDNGEGDEDPSISGRCTETEEKRRPRAIITIPDRIVRRTRGNANQLSASQEVVMGRG